MAAKSTAKTEKSLTKSPKKTTAAKATKSSRTAVRNTSIPRNVTSPAAKNLQITAEQIARKAFEIYASGNGGTELDNWFAAERALKTAA